MWPKNFINDLIYFLYSSSKVIFLLTLSIVDEIHHTFHSHTIKKKKKKPNMPFLMHALDREKAKNILSLMPSEFDVMKRNKIEKNRHLKMICRVENFILTRCHFSSKQLFLCLKEPTAIKIVSWILIKSHVWKFRLLCTSRTFIPQFQHSARHIIKSNFCWCHQRAVNCVSKWWLYGRHEGNTSRKTWQLMTLICVRQQLRNMSSWLLLVWLSSELEFCIAFILLPLFLTCFRMPTDIEIKFSISMLTWHRHRI